MTYDDHFSKTEEQFFQMMTFWWWTFAVDIFGIELTDDTVCEAMVWTSIYWPDPALLQFKYTRLHVDAINIKLHVLTCSRFAGILTWICMQDKWQWVKNAYNMACYK